MCAVATQSYVCMRSDLPLATCFGPNTFFLGKIRAGARIVNHEWPFCRRICRILDDIRTCLEDSRNVMPRLAQHNQTHKISIWRTIKRNSTVFTGTNIRNENQNLLFPFGHYLFRSQTIQQIE